MKKSTSEICLTASKFCALTGTDRHEISKKLTELGCVPTGTRNGGKEFNLRDLYHAAIGGDIAEQRLRKLRAEADILAITLQAKRGELVPTSESVETVTQCAWDIRQAILGLPLEPAVQDSILLQLQKTAEIWQDRADALKEASQE
jgi:hypothetical protein